jgi:hypothetical protein
VQFLYTMTLYINLSLVFTYSSEAAVIRWVETVNLSRKGLTSTDWFKCFLDLNECDGVNYCDGNAMCSNTDGSYDCTCNNGYSGNGRQCEGNS